MAEPPPERTAKGEKYEPGRAIVEGVKYSRHRGGGRGGKREKGGWVRFVPRKYKEVVQLKQDEEKTTVMIKNIPNKYTYVTLSICLCKFNLSLSIYCFN